MEYLPLIAHLFQPRMRPHHAVWLNAHPHRTEGWFRDKIRDGFDVHHVDGDPENNYPSNLILIESADHMMIHSAPERMLRKIPMRECSGRSAGQPRGLAKIPDGPWIAVLRHERRKVAIASYLSDPVENSWRLIGRAKSRNEALKLQFITVLASCWRKGCSMALTEAEEVELIRLLEEERAYRASQDLNEFCRYVPVPGVPIGEEDEDADDLDFYPIGAEPAKHHRLINDALMDVEAGRKKRVMIFMPPGSAKSTYASVTFPAWFMGRKKGRNVIGASYSSDIVKKFGRRCRSIVRAKEYRRVFSDAGLTGDNAAVDDWSMTNGSTYMSGGILSGITGNRADLACIDDPVKNREDADSEALREKTWNEYKDSIRTRLKPGGAIVIIQTRWHEDDLSGRILPENYDGRSGWVEARDGEMWWVICLPAQCEREDDPLGRKPGEWLWTDWFSPEHWEQEKKSQMGRTWNALYQQRPSGEEGAILKRAWWRLWTKPNPPNVIYKIMSVDTAFEEGEENDYSACTIWGVFEDEKKVPRIIMLSAWRDKVEYPDLRAKVRALNKKHRPDVLLIEKKASGHSLIQDLRRTIPNIVAITPKGSKRIRAHAVSAILEAGNVYAPAHRPWAGEVIDECARFPLARNDDYVDTVTMALNRFLAGGWTRHPRDEKDREERDREKPPASTQQRYY